MCVNTPLIITGARSPVSAVALVAGAVEREAMTSSGDVFVVTGHVFAVVTGHVFAVATNGMRRARRTELAYGWRSNCNGSARQPVAHESRMARTDSGGGVVSRTRTRRVGRAPEGDGIETGMWLSAYITVPASHRITSHHITSHHITSHRIA